MDKWYCAVGGEKYGPVAFEVLQQWVREGRLRPGDLVWQEGMADWAAASSVQGLFIIAPTGAPAMVQGAPAPVQVAPQKAAGVALAALILGLCGLIPGFGALCALAAIVLGIVALCKQTSRKGMAIAGLVLGLVMPVVQGIAIALTIPAIQRVKGHAERAACASNMRQIGQAIHEYRRFYGAFPESLDELLGEADLLPRHLRCPACEDSRAEHYFYLPPEQLDRGTMMVCDLAGNHEGGRNVLFADGHVDWMTPEQFAKALARPANARFAEALERAEGP